MKLEEKLITANELEEIEEKRNRMFRVSYKLKNDIYRFEKFFQKKEYVTKLLDDPDVEKVKIYVGDVS